MEEKKNNNKTMMIVIIILLALLIILCGYFFLGGKNTPANNPAVPGGDGNDWWKNVGTDENIEYGERETKSHEEIVEELNKQVEEGMINISMNIYPTFENGTAKGDLLIINNTINRYPQIIEIYTKDDNKLIYRSGVIPVGGRVDYAQLNENLPAGTYNCVAYFNAINTETEEFVGKAGAEIQITVLH